MIVVQLTRRREAQAENNDSTNLNPDTAAPVDSTADSLDVREATPVESDTLAEAAGGTSSQENSATATEKTNEISSQSENSSTEKATTSNCDGTENKEVEKGCSPCQNSCQESDPVNKNKETSVSNTEVKSDETSVSANSTDFEPDICPVSNTELRQRRLDFFSGHSSGNVATDNQSEDKSTESDRINKDSEPSSDSKTKSLSELASDILSSTEQSGTDSVNVNDASEQTEQARTQSETGSGSQDSGLEPGLIRVRIKFLNDTQRLVTALATETIGNFRR